MDYIYEIPWITNEELLAIISSQFYQSLSVVQTQRLVMQNYWRMYDNQSTSNDVIRSNLLYAHCQAWASNRYSDQLTVKFMEKDFSDTDRADKWTKVAEFDKEEMNFEQEEFPTVMDTVVTGVGLMEFVWRDSERSCPIISNRNPMARLPDPKWWLRADNFRWHWFQVMEYATYMKDNGFDMNVIDLFPVKPDQDLRTYDPYNGMPPNTEMQLDTNISLREVLYWYLDINWEKYQVAVNRAFNAIGRIVRIGDFLRAPDDSVPYPFALWYLRPKRHSPFGTSFGGLLGDKQQARQELLNLQLIKVKRNSLGNHRLYDKNKIPNRADLGNPQVNPQLIGIDLKNWEQLANAFYEIPYQQLNSDNQTGIITLDNEARLATAIDPLTMGLNDPNAEQASATEIQDRVDRANIMIAYGNNVTNRGDKDFWWKWKLMYQTNFKKSKKKLIRITNALWYSTFEEITWKNLKTKKDTDIKVMSRTQAQTQMQGKLQSINMMLPFVSQLNDLSPYNMRFAARYAGQQLWLDTETINFMVGQTGEEMKANQQLELLNRNEPLDIKGFDTINDNHDAYLYVYRQALDTPAKRQAIMARIQCKIDQQKMRQEQAWQIWPMQPAPDKWMANAGNSQMVNANIQQANKPSTAQWLGGFAT